MKYLRWVGLLPSLLLAGGLGNLLTPLPAQALTVTIDGATVGLTTAPCPSGYNLCRFIPPGRYGNWTVGNVNDTTNKARILIGDNSTAGSLDLMKLTGIKLTPVVKSGTKTMKVVVTHPYNAGGGNPAGDYAWGYGMAGYLDPVSTENITGDQLQQTGQGNFAGKIAALGLGLDTGKFTTPSANNLNGSVTRSRAATVVMRACNTGSNRCAPTITQTFTLTVVGDDTLVLSDSLIAAGGTCRQADEVISIWPPLYEKMLKLDPNAPNDINRLPKWLADMGEKYLHKPTQKKLLRYLIHALETWLAATVPGTCAEVQTAIDEVIEDDAEAHEAYIAILAALGELFAPAESGPPAPETGTIIIGKTVPDVSSATFTFNIVNIDGSSLLNVPISMDGTNHNRREEEVPAGTYNITENPLAGWTKDSAFCGPADGPLPTGPTAGVIVPSGGRIFCLFNNSPTAGAASIIGLGDIPGGAFSSGARDVSADGSVVVGEGQGLTHQEASRWTAGTGMVSLAPGVSATSIATSSDGSVVVGDMLDASGLERAFRWTPGTGLVDLGTLPSGPGTFPDSVPFGVSEDGTVVVGFSRHTPTGGLLTAEAFRWTQATGMVGLGTLPGAPIISSEATAVSANGSVVVGTAANSSNASELFRWTATGGMQGLGILDAHPTAVSSDGSVIVGYMQNSDDSNDAFLYSQTTGFEVLPGFAGVTDLLRGWAYDVSGDGSVIVGIAAHPGTGEEAVIWRKTAGNWEIRTLKDVLFDYGVTDAVNWNLAFAFGISADGRTIVGSGGLNSGGQGPEAWKIQLP